VNEPQPKPAKFKGRLGNSAFQFGGQDAEPETVLSETVKVLEAKSAKVQTVQNQEEKTVGRTIRFRNDTPGLVDDMQLVHPHNARSCNMR